MAPCVCLTWAASTSVVRNYYLAAAAVHMLPAAQSIAGPQASQTCLTIEVHAKRTQHFRPIPVHRQHGVDSSSTSSSRWHVVCLFNDYDCR
jgi:hypothetical protein